MNLPLLKEDAFYKKLFHLTVPIALQSLMLASVAAADAIMLGNVEQNSMAAVSLATQIQFIQNMIVSAIVATVAVLGAQYWGKKDVKSINEIFWLSLKFSGITSIVFFTLSMFCPELLMKIFADDETLILIGSEYLKVASWSYLLTGISQCYLAIMKVSDHAGKAALISVCTVFINIALNALLIFGLFGIEAMGVKGAATATLISRALELAWAVAASFKKNYIHPKLNSFFAQSMALVKDFVRCMLPLVGACLFWGVGFTSYSAFMGHLGLDSAAANSVVSVLRDLVYCLCNGLSAGAGIVVGNELGSGNLETGKKYGDRLVKVSFAAGALTSLVMLLMIPLAHFVVKLNQNASSYLTGMMLIMAFYSIGRSVNTVLINGIFAAGGDTMFDMYSLAVCMWGIAVPLAALGTFVFHWPVYVVYVCTCLDEVGKIPWVVIHFKKYKWVRDLTR